MEAEMIPDAVVEQFADEFGAYRANPQAGGWNALKARIEKASRKCKVSASHLFSVAHRRYEERLSPAASHTR